MQVTPTKKAFGSYKPGDSFDLPEKTARHLIRVGLVCEVGEVSPRTGRPKRAYTRRDLRAED
jgi:hypothetical protein